MANDNSFFGNATNVLSSGVQDSASKFGLPVGTSAYVMGGASFGVEQAGIDVSRQVKYSLTIVTKNAAASGPAGATGAVANKVASSKLGATSTQSFIFPISPQGLVANKQVLSHWYDVGTSATGASQNAGVQRIMDIYGLAPPIFSITGTTGYNKYRVDNYNQTGTDWMRALQTFIEGYFSSVQDATNGNIPVMQFTDYWYGENWEVAPAGPVQIRQTSQSPLWLFYKLDLVAIKSLGVVGSSSSSSLQSFVKGVATLAGAVAISKLASII